jgi:hypothetical protein
MTAQEVLDTEKAIILASSFPLESGFVFEWPEDNDRLGIPVGTKLVLIDSATFEEADAYCQRVFKTRAIPDQYFYRFIAE